MKSLKSEKVRQATLQAPINTLPTTINGIFHSNCNIETAPFGVEVLEVPDVGDDVPVTGVAMGVLGL